MAEVCSKCGKSKEIATMGSITQWISACGCDARESFDEDVQLICENCGKRISSGRTGSLTQWIFGPNSCECARPATEAAVVAAIEEFEVVPDVVDLDAPVDPKLFPQERYSPLSELGSGAFGAVYLC